ncbi:MAG: hypothetical protein QM691_01530 [Opitutaceae bacterium]
MAPTATGFLLQSLMAGVRRNLFGSVYVTAANLVSQLALVPVYLHFWGASDYGQWLVLFTIPTFFAFTDAGLSNTVGNAVTLSLEQGRPAEAEAKLNAAWKYQGLAWIVLFGALTLVLLLCPMQVWLGVPTMAAGEFNPTVLLLCVYSLAALQSGILAAIYRGARCYPQYLAWNGHTRVAETVLVGAILLLHGRYIAVAAAMAAVRLGGVGILWSHGRGLLPAVQLRLFSGRWCDLRPLLPSGLAYLSFPVSNALINQGTVLVVNHVLGAPAVVLLSVCRQLARVFTQGTSVLLTALHPEMTQACGANDRERIRLLQATAVQIPVAAAIPFIAGIALFGATVVQWWTRKDLGATTPLLVVCALEAVTFGGTTLFSLIAWATNRIKKLSAIYSGLNAAALLIGSIFSVRYGLLAIVAAFACSNLAYCATGLRLSMGLAGLPISRAFTASVCALVLQKARARN